MIKLTVVSLAKKLAALDDAVRISGMMNTPVDVEKRVESQANYRILCEQRDRARCEYSKAFDEWAATGYAE